MRKRIKKYGAYDYSYLKRLERRQLPYTFLDEAGNFGWSTSAGWGRGKIMTHDADGHLCEVTFAPATT